MRNFGLTAVALVSLAAATPIVHAENLSPGTYYIIAGDHTTGIHTNDQSATLTGTITFDQNLNVSAADLYFNDTTTGYQTIFNAPGMTYFDKDEFLVGSLIGNSLVNPTAFYAFSVVTGTNTVPYLFRLTCGVDCDTEAYTADGSSDVEFGGFISPVPEPSTFALLGTGALGAVTTLRRRLRRS